MKREQAIREALNDCIDRLLRGESVQECLHLYPSLATELAPLLQVASASLKATMHLRSTPQLRARILAQVLAQRDTRRPQRRWVFSRLRPWLLAPAISMLLIGAFWGVAGASANSAPGNPLYPVKTFRERVALAMARSPEAQARLNAALARRRAEEADRLLARGEDGEALEGLFYRMALHTRQAASYLAKIPEDEESEEEPHMPLATESRPAPVEGRSLPRAVPLPPGLARREALRLEVRRELLEHLKTRDARWQEALRRAPPDARPRLEQAYRQWRQQAQEALQALGQPLPQPPQRPGLNNPIPGQPQPP